MTIERTGAKPIQGTRRIRDGIRPKFWIGEKLMDFIVEPLLISDAHLEGAENLQVVRDLLLTQGKHVVIAANHISHADGPAIHTGLSRNGFGDLAKKCVYLSGLRMEDKFYTRVLGRRAKTIQVWPPTIPAETDNQRREKLHITRDALYAAQKVHESGGIIVMFGEGHRSEDSTMQPVSPAIEYFLRDKVVLPVGIWGTEKIKPIKGGFRRGPVSVRVGQAIDIGQYTASLSEATPDQRKQLVVNRVMLAVAKQLPDSYRGYYAV